MEPDKTGFGCLGGNTVKNFAIWHLEEEKCNFTGLGHMRSYEVKSKSDDSSSYFLVNSRVREVNKLLLLQ